MNLVQTKQQNAIWLAEEKEKELQIQRREEMLKQFKLQLQIKQDKENEEKKKDIDNVKEVSDTNDHLLLSIYNIIFVLYTIIVHIIL